MPGIALFTHLDACLSALALQGSEKVCPFSFKEILCEASKRKENNEQTNKQTSKRQKGDSICKSLTVKFTPWDRDSERRERTPTVYLMTLIPAPGHSYVFMHNKVNK